MCDSKLTFCLFVFIKHALKTHKLETCRWTGKDSLGESVEQVFSRPRWHRIRNGRWGLWQRCLATRWWSWGTETRCLSPVLHDAPRGFPKMTHTGRGVWHQHLTTIPAGPRVGKSTCSPQRDRYGCWVLKTHRREFPESGVLPPYLSLGHMLSVWLTWSIHALLEQLLKSHCCGILFPSSRRQWSFIIMLVLGLYVKNWSEYRGPVSWPPVSWWDPRVLLKVRGSQAPNSNQAAPSFTVSKMRHSAWRWTKLLLTGCGLWEETPTPFQNQTGQAAGQGRGWGCPRLHALHPGQPGLARCLPSLPAVLRPLPRLSPEHNGLVPRSHSGELELFWANSSP